MHEAAEGVSMLRDGMILLGFGLGFVLLFRRLGLGATLGFLVAGAVVGPHVLSLVGDAESKMGIAELGITLPEPAKAVANYVPFVQAGSLVHISGHCRTTPRAG